MSDEHVLEVARRVFSAQGYGAATRQIAHEAGLSQAALFQRFTDKPTLFLAALVPAPIDVPAIVAPLRGALPDDPLAALQETAGRLLDAMREIVPLLTALSTSPALDQAILRETHERLRGETLLAALSVAFTRWSRAGILPSHLDPDRTVESILVAVHGVLLMARTGHFGTTDAERAALTRTVATLWGPTPSPAIG